MEQGRGPCGLYSLWAVRGEGGLGVGCDHGGEGGDRRVAKARRTAVHGALRFLSGCSLQCSFQLLEVYEAKEIGW